MVDGQWRRGAGPAIRSEGGVRTVGVRRPHRPAPSPISGEGDRTRPAMETDARRAGSRPRRQSREVAGLGPTDAASRHSCWRRCSGRSSRAVESRRIEIPSTAPVGRFVLDFYCPERRLVVELDGPVHDGAARSGTRSAASSSAPRACAWSGSETRRSSRLQDVLVRLPRTRWIPQPRFPLSQTRERGSAG